MGAKSVTRGYLTVSLYHDKESQQLMKCQPVMSNQFDSLPEWARWLAQDANGAWWAFEHEPNEGATSWYENEVGRYQRVGSGAPNREWRTTLEKIIK